MIPSNFGYSFDNGSGACDCHKDLYDDFEWVCNMLGAPLPAIRNASRFLQILQIMTLKEKAPFPTAYHERQ